MGNENSQTNKSRFESLLLEEYRYFTKSFWRSEELGENRVNFFITLSGFILTLLGAIATSGILLGFNLSPIYFQLVCFILWLFGWITLTRLIQRNYVSDEFKLGLDRIRKFFCQKGKG